MSAYREAIVRTLVKAAYLDGTKSNAVLRDLRTKGVPDGVILSGLRATAEKLADEIIAGDSEKGE